jgi:hypothetical protein
MEPPTPTNWVVHHGGGVFLFNPDRARELVQKGFDRWDEIFRFAMGYGV